MNYCKIYTNLIEKARNRPLSHGSYYEYHHIRPKCMGGDDTKENLVALTPEEHYVAHQLLVKIYPKNDRLVLAAYMMVPNRKSNKLYGWLKRKHQLIMQELQAKDKNSQYGTRWIYNEDKKISTKISKKASLPLGWKEGRKINFTETLYTCKRCDREFKQSKNEKYCSILCKKYRNNSSYYTIDSNLDDIIKMFNECKSITKVLKSYGLEGRRGNAYLSSILKEKNIEVLKRKNS